MGISVCYTGGAKGADTIFGQHAAKMGHHVFHYGFRGMQSNGNKLHILDYMQLKLADPQLRAANEVLKRGNFDNYKEYTKNLLRRNYYQIDKSQCVYAVSYLKDGLCQGGTGWAVHMAILHGVPKIFVYDQSEKDWFGYHALINGFNPWVRLSHKRPPRPSGQYTGIGSVEITEAGINAITNLYKE